MALNVPASWPISSSLRTDARAPRSPAEMRLAARASSSTGAASARALQAPSSSAAATPARSASPRAFQTSSSAWSTHRRGRLTWTTPVTAPREVIGAAAKIRVSWLPGSRRIAVAGVPASAEAISGATAPAATPAQRPVAGGRPQTSLTPT